MPCRSGGGGGGGRAVGLRVDCGGGAHTLGRVRARARARTGRVAQCRRVLHVRGGCGGGLGGGMGDGCERRCVCVVCGGCNSCCWIDCEHDQDYGHSTKLQRRDGGEHGGERGARERAMGVG